MTDEDYWSESFACCIDELGMYDHFSQEQIEKAGKILSLHADSKHMAFGYEEADRSVRCIQIEESENNVLNWLSELVADAVDGDGRAMIYMSENQKIALSRLMHAKQEFRRDKETKERKG